VGLRESNIVFKVNGNVWIIFIIRKEWKNTSGSTRSIVVRELHK